MQRTLREGFTTGTAAAAATAAAVASLLGAGLPATVLITLPPFLPATPGVGEFRPGPEARLAVPVAGGGPLPDGSAWAEVIKDGGDDPDATHGARITARAALQPFAPGEYNGPPLQAPDVGRTVTLYSGEGIGLVTLPGLPVTVGEAAINPAPRRQITFAALEAAAARAHTGPLHILLAVPDGRERARRTMNARLGILGGISLLGVHGTVRPFSHDAWKATISQGMDVAAALHLPEVLCSTGRRSERLGFALYPHLAPQAGIQAADFAAHAARTAGRHGFTRLIWVCFPGKLLKLAQGLEWTHAASAAADLHLLARFCAEAGADAELAQAVAALPTATGAFALLTEAPAVRAAVLRRLGQAARNALAVWLAEGASPTAPPDLRLHVFSLDQELALTL